MPQSPAKLSGKVSLLLGSQTPKKQRKTNKYRHIYHFYKPSPRPSSLIGSLLISTFNAPHLRLRLQLMFEGNIWGQVLLTCFLWYIPAPILEYLRGIPGIIPGIWAKQQNLWFKVERGSKRRYDAFSNQLGLPARSCKEPNFWHVWMMRTVAICAWRRWNWKEKS